MADNTELNLGSGGDIIATDDLAGVKHQLVKVEFGGDGVATMVSTTNPLPVQLADGADVALVTAGGALLVDGSGATQPVSLPDLGVVNAGNSSTTPLANDATFTGTFVDVTNYASIVVSIFANQASATDGVVFQWSSDGTNVDITASSELPASSGRAYVLSPRAQFFRVVYTNGGVSQGAFRLETILRTQDVGPVTRPLDKVIDDTFFAQLTRTVVAAKRNDGTYGNIRSTNGNNLKVAVSEFDGVSLPAGTNNIGDVDVVTAPATAAEAAALPTVFQVVAGDDGTDTHPLQLSATGDLKMTLDGETVAIASLPDEGQQTMANSISVAIASNQSAVPVSGTVTANAGTGDFLSIAAHTTNEALKENMAIGGQLDDTGTTAATEDNVAPVRITAQRALHANLRNVAGTEIGTAGAPIRIDPTNATATTVSGTVTANLAAGTNTNEVVGDVAQDVAIAGNPVAIGMRASTAIPAAMSADGDVVYPWANRSGAQVITQAPHVGLNSDPWALAHAAAQYTTTQTSTVLVNATGAQKIVVTKVQIQAFATTAFTMQLYFGTAAFSRGTSRSCFDGEFAPSATLKPGVILDGPFIAGALDDDLRVTTSTTGSVTVSVWYYYLTA